MEWLWKGIVKSFEAALSPIPGGKRKRGEAGTAEEPEVEQPPPCKRRSEPELPLSLAQIDLAAGVSTAARAKPGTRDIGTLRTGQGSIRSGIGRGNALAQWGRETPQTQSPVFQWSEFPLPKQASPAVQRHSVAEDKQPPTVHPGVPGHPGVSLLRPPGSRFVQAVHHREFGPMGLGGSKPSSRAAQQTDKEMLQLAVRINAKLEEQQPRLRLAACEANKLEMDLTGPSTLPEAAPPAPAPLLHPWADWSSGAAARQLDERSESPSFLRRTQGILSDVLEPTDNDFDFQQKKQASNLAVKRVQQLEVSFGALLRKADAAIGHGAEEAAEKLQRELLKIQQGGQELRLEQEQQAQQAAYAEEEVVVKTEQLPAEELPPLPADWYARYEDLTANSSSLAVIISHQRSNIDIRWHDMAKLAPLEWLNDEVINVYMSMLLERDARRREEGAPNPTCHFFSSFFANKLYKDNGYKYDQVRRWTLPKKLKSNGQGFSCVLDCDRIIMPVHQGVHWVCAVIDLKQHKFVYYDSLQSEDERCLESLAKWLRDEYKDKKKEVRDDVLDWPREYPKNIPEQKNGCDCGVFTLLFADYAGRDAPMRFAQKDIQYFRVRIVGDIMALQVA